MNTNYKQICAELNKKIKEYGLVKLTWGNVSVISKCRQFVFIKPSGVPFRDLTENQVSVIDIMTGLLIDGKKQSVDTNIHLEIYKSFSDVNSIIHTHSKYATSYAQACAPIRCLGTTHADYFKGGVPVSRHLSKKEIELDYEKNIGVSVCEWFYEAKISPLEKGAILLPHHGVLTFGTNGTKALENAIVLEQVAEMNMLTEKLNGTIEINENTEYLFNKHYERKNGEKKYYGQG